MGGTGKGKTGEEKAGDGKERSPIHPTLYPTSRQSSHHIQPASHRSSQTFLLESI